jgi:hypothetical protein
VKDFGSRSIVILSLCGFLAACGAGAEPPAPIEGVAPETPSASQVLPNLLLEIDGAVELRRTGWAGFLPADFGAVLRPGDLVRVAEGGQAAVFCGDETTWAQAPSTLVGDGQEHGVPCGSGRPPRPWPDVAALRGAADTETGHVVQPRNTALLSSQPNLVWESSGADGEMLSIVSVLSDDGKERPPIESSKGSLAWPDSWPPLEPGATYVLFFGDEAVDASTTVGRGFWLLDASRAEELRSREVILRRSGLSETAQRLLVAELYRSYGLYAEAIDLLKRLTEATPSPAIWLNLGRIYLETGLPDEASDSCAEALALAERLGDLPSAGEAHLGIALAAQLQEDATTFDEHLEQARTIFEQVGDEQMLQEIERLTP